MSGVKDKPAPVPVDDDDDGAGEPNEKVLVTGLADHDAVDCVGEENVCGLNEKLPGDAVAEDAAAGGVVTAVTDGAVLGGDENEKPPLPLLLAGPPNENAVWLPGLLLLLLLLLLDAAAAKPPKLDLVALDTLPSVAPKEPTSGLKGWLNDEAAEAVVAALVGGDAEADHPSLASIARFCRTSARLAAFVSPPRPISSHMV